MRDKPCSAICKATCSTAGSTGRTLVTHILVKSYATRGVALFGAVNNATS